ncbi:MAG: type III secretion system chaperone [Candidatus Accumulibacter sp.]|jgi:hypothetical protein|nr:type III secretion system chaperone [Accumulibacter sp.]
MQEFFQHLIQSLSEAVGEPLAIEEGTRVHCDFDEFPLLFQYLPDAEQVLLAVPLAEIPEDDREARYRALLHGQYLFHQTGGGALSLDEEGRFACLQIVKDIRSLTPENFPVLVENFLHVAQYWRDRCLAADPAEAAGTSSTAPTAEPHGVTMLRV